MSHSYWLNKKILNCSIPTGKTKYDFVIVGGGIAGLSAAYWLQQIDPTLKIALIEKNVLGFGASGRNAGFVTCGSIEHFIKLKVQFGLEKAVEIWKFSEVNHQLLSQHIIMDQADHIDYKRTGSCTVAANTERWSDYLEVAKLMCGSGIDMSEVDSANLEKDYGITGFAGGMYYAGDGYVHPIKLLQKIYQKLNIDVFENTEVLAINDKTVQTANAVFETDKVILTLNAYLPLVNPNYKSLITPGRGQILLTKPLPYFVNGPCYLTKHLCYFRQLPTGELLIGGFRNLAVEVENTYQDEITPLIQNALYDFVKTHFKYGTQAKIAYQWSGTMGFSSDGQLLIGNTNESPNTFILAGCSGHGMGLHFHAAKILIESIFGKNIPAHLNINRFEKNK